MNARDLTLLVPLKFVGEIASGGTPKSDSTNWGGDIPFITPPDLNGLDGAVVRQWDRSLTELGAAGSTTAKDAVLLSCRAPIGHIGVATREVAFNQGCKAIVPEHPEDLAYLAHCLVAHRTALRAAGRGTTFAELSTTELSSFAVPWPSPSRRRAIADYLGRETGEIDAMIAKMDELAGTLKARRETVVLESIRRQDNLTLQSLRLAASLVTGSTPAGGQEANFSDTGTMGWVTPEDLASPVRASRFLSAAGLGQLRVVPGCSVLVCCIGATVGKLGYADQPITTNQQITAVVPRQGISGRYLYYALTAEHSQILSEAVTTTLPIINNARLGGLAVRIPSQSAQRRIADYLDEVTSKIDAMLAKVAELKSLLIERRAALITDVVTGRKAVA